MKQLELNCNCNKNQSVGFLAGAALDLICRFGQCVFRLGDRLDCNGETY